MEYLNGGYEVNYAQVIYNFACNKKFYIFNTNTIVILSCLQLIEYITITQIVLFHQCLKLIGN